MKSIISLVVAALFLQTIPPIIYLPVISNDASTATPLPTATATATRLPEVTATLVPTLTPTVIFTPIPEDTPTQTPSPTPTATATGALQVLENHTVYTSTFGATRYIVGEVRNNSASSVQFVSITADIYNAGNQLIDTEQTYLKQDLLPATGKGCFKVIFFAPPADWATYQLITEGSITQQLPPSLTITSAISTSNTTSFELVGQVRNDGPTPHQYAHIVGTLYNSTNQVIGCDDTYATTETLAPGATSSWKLTFYGIKPDLITSYRLMAD